MKDWRNEAVRLASEGQSAGQTLKKILEDNEIYDKKEFDGLTYEKAYEKMRNFLKRQRRKGVLTRKNGDDASGYGKSVYYSKGETTVEGIIELLDGEPITAEKIMAAHNLDCSYWEVVSYRSNFWQTQMKGGIKSALYQSRITVRPRTSVSFCVQDIEDYFKDKDFAALPACSPPDYDIGDEVLEIDYTDLHVGLLSWRPETGMDFDLKLIRDRFLSSISDIAARCKNRKFRFVRFITLGDILHIDNSRQTTTNGTFQQVDGRIAKIFDYAADMLIAAVLELKKLRAKIEYVYVAGNHDRDTGYFLAKCVQLAFNKDESVVFDIEPNPLKIKSYGVSVVGYGHGDIPRKNLEEWIIKQFRKETAEAKYVEIHYGHLHSKTEEEISGCRIIRLPSLCESSYWEHQQGYTCERALMCFVWNMDNGKRETWITNF